MSTTSLRTFIVYVDDLPGVLNRVVSLFRRRGFNIASLNVGHTHEAGLSRMTIVVEESAEAAPRVIANLYKLVNVIQVQDITDKPAVERHLALIKVGPTPSERPNLFMLCEVFRARIVDVGSTTVMVEMTGGRDKIESLVNVLRPFNILELVQTGAVVMARGEPSPSVLTVNGQESYVPPGAPLTLPGQQGAA